jgi:hypothetical protein
MEYDCDKPEYQRLVEVLSAAGSSKRGQSGYGVDVSDMDIAFLWEETFAKMDALEADLLALVRYHKAYVRSVIDLWSDKDDDFEAAHAALSDRVKRMLEDEDE